MMMYGRNPRDIELIAGTSLQSRAGDEDRLSSEVDLWQSGAGAQRPEAFRQIAVLIPERRPCFEVVYLRHADLRVSEFCA